MFKYLDHVEISEGFFQGQRGFVMDQDTKPGSDQKLYLVRIDGPTLGQFVDQWFSSKLLNKLELPKESSI